jgi:hypothetical protein
VDQLCAGRAGAGVLALLPKDIAPFAAWAPSLLRRRLHCRLAPAARAQPAKVEQAQEIAAQQSWREFADSSTRLAGRGLHRERLNQAGADFVLTRRPHHRGQRRRWKAAAHGVEPLRELQAAGQARDAATVCTCGCSRRPRMQPPGPSSRASP